jgi:Zn-dependent membrane protease YugP
MKRFSGFLCQFVRDDVLINIKVVHVFRVSYFRQKMVSSAYSCPGAVAPTKGAAGPAIAAKIYENIPLTASKVVAAVMGSAMLRERS